MKVRTDSSRPAALVFPDNPAALAAARELGCGGIEVYVLSRKPGPAARSRFARFVEVPNLYTDHRRWMDAICEFGKTLPAAPVLVATEDAALLALDHYQRELDGNFVLPYPGSGIVTTIVDKRALYDAAQRVHVTAPEHREIADATELRDMPPNGWLVKPAFRYQLSETGVRSARQMLGGTKAVAGDLELAVQSVLDAGFPPLLQEAIPGGFEDLVTVAMYLRKDGSLGDFYTTRKYCEYPEPFGDGLIVRTVRDPGVVEPAVRLMREMGYWGLCEVEFKKDRRDGRFKLLDANPRPWLWMSLGTRSGKHLLLSAYSAATGQRCATRLHPPKASAKPKTWVSTRGTGGFMSKCYQPRRHGVVLPLKLIMGCVGTSLRNLGTFRDPSRPWPRKARQRTAKTNGSGDPASSNDAGHDIAGALPAGAGPISALASSLQPDRPTTRNASTDTNIDTETLEVGIPHAE